MNNDAGSAPSLGPTRRRVLALLQESPHELPIDEIATPLGLHANSVRFHLDALYKQGQVRRVVESRATQGRPRVLFTANPASPSVADGAHRELANALLVYVSDHEGEDAELAERVGRSWGLSMDGLGAVDALDALVQRVNEIGFASRLNIGADNTTLDIARCPFRDMALSDRTICRIHLGMMRGFLEAREADVTVESLEPWVTADLCRAQLAPSR